MANKKSIVISAINFFEGGPLSVFKDCLDFVNNSKYQDDYKFVALVHKKELFDQMVYSNIDFIEFPKSRKSYFYRLYYEYIYFRKFAENNNVSFWFSLHDMTPSVGKIPQAVYCHNPSPFNSLNFKDIYVQPTQFFFRLFYSFLYQINIKRNKYVVVQQLWMKNKFVEMFGLNKNNIIVAPPEVATIHSKYLNIDIKLQSEPKIFFFPTFPRPFKNIEVICEAVKLLFAVEKKFKVVITIDGSENKYSKTVFNLYKKIENINFIGLIKREEVYEYYSKSDCLIFPSKLETWGLPISEFKQFKKPMLLADLPYAKETVGNYDFVNFFDPNDHFKLAELMLNFLNTNQKFEKNNLMNDDEPCVHGWSALFEAFLKK